MTGVSGMETLGKTWLSVIPTIPSLENGIKTKKLVTNLSFPASVKTGIRCTLSGDGIEEKPSSNSTITIPKKSKMEEYNAAMKNMMKNPYEYHHELGQFLFRLNIIMS